MAYGTLKESYEKVVTVMGSGKRILGRYYRVAFYGRVSETKEFLEFKQYSSQKNQNLQELKDILQVIFFPLRTLFYFNFFKNTLFLHLFKTKFVRFDHFLGKQKNIPLKY